MAAEAAAPLRVPGVGSTAIAGLLEPRATGAVLGLSSHAVWLVLDDAVIVVSTADATRLPNGVEIGVNAATDPFQSVRHAEPVEMGDNRILLAGLTVDVVRWWDPRPVLPSVPVAELAAAIGSLPDEVPGIDGSLLADALGHGSGPAVLAAAENLLGSGTGLTPEGDDYLAGAVAALRILGPAVGDSAAAALLEAIAAPLAELASAMTTTFSAALMAHARRGEVAAPAGDFLRALSGRGDVDSAHAALSKVGHTSGPALAAGIVLGARSIVRLNV